jgi:hypothetical protein
MSEAVKAATRRIKLTAEQQSMLLKQKNGQMEVQQFVQTVMQAGQQKIAELVALGSVAWEKIAADHGLDLKNQNWELNQKGDEIVLVAERYANE